MMKKLLLPILLFLSLFATAQIEKALPKPPNPPRLVTDETGTLTPDQMQALERKLVAYDDSTSNQIAVVIIRTTGDYDIADFSFALGRSWGIGNKKNNNGVLVLVAKDDRKVFIAPGYGLEGAIPDITAKQIVDDIIVPNFKGADFYGGLDQGTDALMAAARGEYTAPPGYAERGGGGGFPVLPIIIIIIIIFIIISRGGGRGGSFMSRRGYRNFNGPPIIWFPSGGSSGGGGWSGGGGGGGFGGFGGGSFGGGGAGGSW